MAEAVAGIAEPVVVDVVSDVVCPWCYVGRARLGEAIRSRPDLSVTLRWRPFQLDPTLPPEGRDRHAYMMGKFGSAERILDMHRQISQIGQELGISFDFDAIKVSPNTLDAHRVIRWSATAGPGVQDRLVGRLFALYFEEGANIGDHAVLIDAARDAGMDAALVETLLATEADRPEVQQEIATAQKMGVTGVPCFLLEGRYAVMGAQEPAALADAISKVAEAKANGTLDAPQR
ncbi:DsbA family oxidoreductase [Nitratireductor pacificus]|uniref:DSBA oxidoreductase n=1 Tax=Nitratireductor pacificus pht-3B TaxID=391937 RepID=K2LIG4_9HYPH|nr:DsbA family protein [Nitratireductor pacificus]EKF17534.1 DSBA oxidoreductase [Nitratireductor pacificus pht-3B]